MKNFLKNLASGLAFAVFAALEICYFVWSFNSIHRMLWFIISVIVLCLVACYLSSSDTVYEDINGKQRIREMTMPEKFVVAISFIVGIALLGGLLWVIGYGVAYVFDLKVPFWEMYMLYGLIASVLIGTLFWLIDFTMHFSTTDMEGRRAIAGILKKVLMWLFIIACSSYIGGVIIYYLLPLAKIS